MVRFEGAIFLSRWESLGVVLDDLGIAARLDVFAEHIDEEPGFVDRSRN